MTALNPCSAVKNPRKGEKNLLFVVSQNRASRHQLSMKNCVPTVVLRWCALLIAGLALASGPAGAVPVGVHFNGPTNPANMENLGTVDPAPGVPAVNFAPCPTTAGVITDAVLCTIPGTLDVVDRSVNSVSPTGNRVNSTWMVENLRPDLEGDLYLVFATAPNFENQTPSGPVTSSYDMSTIALEIDSADGWIIAEADDTTLGDLRYAAVLLNFQTDPLGGNPLATIDVTYLLDDPQLVGDFVLLPELQVLLGFAPVPEPGTGVLLALGMTGLGVARRKRK